LPLCCRVAAVARDDRHPADDACSSTLNRFQIQFTPEQAGAVGHGAQAHAGGRCPRVYPLTVVLDGEHDFRPGDAFSYGRCWSHPISPDKPGATRLLVLKVDGQTLTVNQPAPGDFKGDRIAHFFPPVCSYNTEFAEVKDLTIVGPENNPAGCSGGFQTNPVTFGVTSNPRWTRLNIEGFPADGISAQGCDDGRALDCTVRGTGNGFHPGTTTLRFMAARNYSVDNRSGLFFCWYNSNGVYFRNRLKNFTGYPDSGDVFNTLACNHLTAPMAITVGYNGCLFNNRLEAIRLRRQPRQAARRLGARPGRAQLRPAAALLHAGAQRRCRPHRALQVRAGQRHRRQHRP